MRIPVWLRRYQTPAILVLVIALAAGGYLAFGAGGGVGATYTVVRANTPRTVAISGTVKAASDADLGFAESGRIAATYAVVGQHVAAGAVLAEIENGDEAAAVQKAQANLASLTAGTRPEELAAAETAVAGDEAALADAIRSAYVTVDDAIRNHADALFTNPLSSPAFKYPNNGTLKDTLEKERRDLSLTLSEWQASVGALTPSAASLAAETAQQNLTAVETFLDNINRALSEALSAAATSYEASIATARTNVADASTALTKSQSTLADDEKTLTLKRAGSTAEDIAAGQADLANAEAALVKTRVIAPFAGVVTKMDAKVGEIVSPTASEIALQSQGVYQIEVYVPEVSIAGVAVGDAATTTLDAYGPTVPFAATVIAVAPAETEKDGVPTYKTTLAFTAPDPRIRSGMTANVVIETGVLVNAVVIPAGAVGHDTQGAYVSILTGNKKVARQAVTTGETPALGQVEVTAGLAGGETILLAPR